MSSRAGPRASGTDGTDYLHRQRVAAHYQESATYKFYLKALFGLHILVLICLWAKVGSEVLRRDFNVELPLFKLIDLPSAYPWEYVYCLSFIPIICGFLAFPRNKAKWIDMHYYTQFLLAILPCVIGLASQIPEFFDWIQDRENSATPTFKGSFPMVLVWFVFFMIAMQIHVGAMYLSYQLSKAWGPKSHSE